MNRPFVASAFIITGVGAVISAGFSDLPEASVAGPPVVLDDSTVSNDASAWVLTTAGELDELRLPSNSANPKGLRNRGDRQQMAESGRANGQRGPTSSAPTSTPRVIYVPQF